MNDKTTNAGEEYNWDQFDLETAPFDTPSRWDGSDWGGDGSDLYRPVRKHVLQALVPTDDSYPAHIEALCALGQPEQNTPLPEYPGITQDDLHDLVRMARDRKLQTATKGDAMWGPIHAVYALTRLDISTVVEEVVLLLDLDVDWYDSILIVMLAKVGTSAIQPLKNYLNDPSRWVYGRWRSATALGEMVAYTPDVRGDVLAVLHDALSNAKQHEPELNAGIISALVAIKAHEEEPLLHKTLAEGLVDESITGDWLHVTEKLGIEPDQDDPLVQKLVAQREAQKQQRSRVQSKRFMDMLYEDQLAHDPETQRIRSLPNVGKTAQQEQQKRKNKRKQTAASRKANRTPKKKRR